MTINQFMLNQTIHPNIFYLWLSEEEFPNKENDLPQELLNSIKLFGIRLQWLKDNEYTFKRWKVYPKHYNDYVLSIDDDSYHSPTLIKDALNILSEYKSQKIICNVWRQFSAVPYYNNDIKINWRYENNLVSNNVWWCGTAMIAPKTFPLQIFDDDLVQFRKKYFPRNDEVMFNAFGIRDDILKAFIPKAYPYQAFENEKQTAIASEQTKIGDDGYKPLEKNLYLMLDKLGIIEKYQMIYNNYNTTKFLRK